MVVEPLSYTQAILIGFLTGSLIFLISGLFVTISYFDQLWLLITCLVTCVALACAATFVHHRLSRVTDRLGRRGGYQQ